MKDAVDADGEPLPDEGAYEVGVFMRQLSLDELPQL
jgi:lipopolysaccharide/colanic/teichoic acid biosynthesis glycosyltransferase